jgi:Spy/CpxP family protein refolding chaperone
MRKHITLLIAALMMALTMSFGGAAAAFAAQPQDGQPGNQEGGGGPNKAPGQTQNPNDPKTGN